jgi:hypothetical protein
MEIYRIPRREVTVRLLVDDGRALEGTLFTAEAGFTGQPEDVLEHLNDPDEEFVPVHCGAESLLVNKAGVLWVQVSGVAAEEIAARLEPARQVPVRLSLSGGNDLTGMIAIVMPLERSRIVDYLNAAGRFFPLLGDRIVTIVQRRFVVAVRDAERIDWV